MMTQLDTDRSTIVEADELGQMEARLAQAGVEGVPDSFMGRWDVDGDGKISDAEIPSLVQVLLRRRAR